MTLNKYSDLMNQVRLTDDMKARILQNVEKKNRAKRKSKIIQIGVVVTSLAAVLFISIIAPWNKNPRTRVDEEPAVSSTGVNDGTEGQIAGGEPTEDINLALPPQIGEYKNAEELSAAAGITINDLENLPFIAAETDYLLYNDKPEIKYYKNEYEALIYIMYSGDGEPEGLEFPYDFEKTITVAGISVNVKGVEDRIILAYWKDNDNMRCIFYETGLDEKELELMMN